MVNVTQEMKHYLFIDHPAGLEDYEFLSGEHSGADVVSRKLGIGVKFVCNSYAKMSKGDIYEVPFDRAEDVTAFLLKNRYELIPSDKIEKYRQK